MAVMGKGGAVTGAWLTEGRHDVRGLASLSLHGGCPICPLHSLRLSVDIVLNNIVVCMMKYLLDVSDREFYIIILKYP